MKRLELLKIDNLLLCLLIVIFSYLIASTLHAGPVPDTGQTHCYDNDKEIPCPQPGETFYGQDGSYIINPPSYTKLDEYGNPLPDFALSWTMVRCNRTGLIWEVKTDDGLVHDKDNQYTWQQATDVFISNLNTNSFGGFSDWRLPTLKELAFLFHRDSYPPIDLNYFPNTIFTDFSTSWYWTSTSFAYDSSRAWAIKYLIGYFSPANNKMYSLHVRAVRGEKILDSPEGLIDNGNNTVTDTTTGLMWQQVPMSGTGVWENDLFYCETLELGTYKDWRLPNTKELVSIIDYGKYDPAINSDFFPGPATSFRSSTTIMRPPPGEEAWILMTKEGNLLPGQRKNEWSNVRCVRGGQVWASAYSRLFSNRYELLMLRDYRDKFIFKSKRGKFYINLLYKNSKPALNVLLDNPELMCQANELIAANKEAVSMVLDGEEGVVYNTDEIVAFLDAYAKKSPIGLKILAYLVKWDMLKKQKRGQLFFGFRLE
jgi:hypothetical protein